MVNIYIDADACPVKAETLKVAERYGVHTFIVSNGGMRPSRDPLITTVTVPAGPDIADDWIAERVEPNDVVVTQDIPLASRTLESGGHAIGPSGKVFDTDSIGMALAVREINQHIREATQGQTRHRAFSDRDRSHFLQVLDRTLVQAQKQSEKTP